MAVPINILPLLVRATKVALLVGTCLTLINQADALFGDAPTAALWWKIPLTYSVPFLVSLYSSVAAVRERLHDVSGDAAK